MVAEAESVALGAEDSDSLAVAEAESVALGVVDSDADSDSLGADAVSYTHLTLPTNREV